jgi:hypothetical protein
LRSIRITMPAGIVTAGIVVLAASVYQWGLVTLFLAALGVVIAEAAKRLAQQKYDEPSAREPLMVASMEPSAVTQPVYKPRRSRSHLQVVRGWFTASPDYVDTGRLAQFDMPDSVRPEQRATVSEYVQAGHALARALEPNIADQGDKVRLHAGSVDRFAQAEAAYAQLGYRTLELTLFRAMAKNQDPHFPQKLAQPLADGETNTLYAPHIRARFVRRRLRSAG